MAARVPRHGSRDTGRSLVRQIADSSTVLQRGRAVDQGRSEEVFSEATSPYTRQLIDAIPAAPRLLT